MTLSVLPELMSIEKPFLCRKPEWPEGEYIFGCPRREIPNAEIPRILLFEDHVRCFLDGKNMFVDRTFWHVSIHTDEDGNKRHLVKQWHPTHEDLITIEWETADLSLVYEDFKEELNEQITQKHTKN